MDGLLDGACGGLGGAEWVEHHEVVVDAVVADAGGGHACLRQPGGVGFAFVAENVVLVDRRQAAEVIQ
jgi:hypothetical protein